MNRTLIPASVAVILSLVPWDARAFTRTCFIDDGSFSSICHYEAMPDEQETILSRRREAIPGMSINFKSPPVGSQRPPQQGAETCLVDIKGQVVTMIDGCSKKTDSVEIVIELWLLNETTRKLLWLGNGLTVAERVRTIPFAHTEIIDFYGDGEGHEFVCGDEADIHGDPNGHTIEITAHAKPHRNNEGLCETTVRGSSTIMQVTVEEPHPQ